MEVTAATASRPTARATAWGGIVFAVLYVGGIMLMLGPTPDDTNRDRPTKFADEWYRVFSDSGKRTQMILGAYVVIVASIALIIFGSQLRDRLAARGAAGSGRLTFAGSILFGALTTAGAIAMAWIPATKSLGDTALPRGEIVYLAPQLAFGLLLIGGGAGAALMLVSAGIGSIRTDALPTWLGWAAIVIGVIVFALGALFLPMVLLVLWVLVAATVVLRRPLTAAALL